ncbi:MAG TPA: septal ring lytic transglycosylase RlpA family protein [Bradyrhizobium sp.]|nr:septal ring lytic transglycosylase RlpA family protein [Bradyrhizobium sp.]
MQIPIWCVAVPLLILGSASAAAESGLASFYPGVGRSGEMTCAHRSHPFGRMLKVTHGKRSIECRVNDRGPFKRGRIIDVSTSAARALGMIDAGVVPVLVEAVENASKAVKEAERNEAEKITVPLGSL